MVQHEEAYERYDYLYSEQELTELVKEIKETRSDRYLLYFNTIIRERHLRTPKCYLDYGIQTNPESTNLNRTRTLL